MAQQIQAIVQSYPSLAAYPNGWPHKPLQQAREFHNFMSILFSDSFCMDLLLMLVSGNNYVPEDSLADA